MKTNNWENEFDESYLGKYLASIIIQHPDGKIIDANKEIKKIILSTLETQKEDTVKIIKKEVERAINMQHKDELHCGCLEHTTDLIIKKITL